MKISDFTPLIRLKGSSLSFGSSGRTAASAPTLNDLGLSPGQIIKARITGFTPRGQALLEINGQTLTAQSRVALPATGEVWLEVKQAGDTVWLGLAERKGAIQELLSRLLSDSGSLKQSIEILTTLTATAPEQLDPELQKAVDLLFQHLGQNAVSDKPEVDKLLKMLSWLNSDRGKEQLALPAGRPPLLSGLERLSATLELFQQLNSLPPQADQSSYYMFPCFFAGGAGWGEWIFSLDRETKENVNEGSAYALSFFLNMSRLGEVHLQMNANRNSSLTGMISLSDEEARQHVESHLPEFVLALKNLGYDPVKLYCRSAPGSLAGELKQFLLEKGGLKPFTILDVTA